MTIFWGGASPAVHDRDSRLGRGPLNSSEIGNALTEIAAYGTAVITGPRPPG